MDERPTHHDYFTGIGGFTLAAQWAGFRTTRFCEVDPFCSRLLAERWPNIPNEGDIRRTKGGRCHLLTGGFPCQPYSVAGKQLGLDDERDLWQEMLRIIKESRPTWVVAENSPNILNMAFRQIKLDLEAIDYQVGEPLIIPACAVNADHRRARVWICAHSDPCGLQGCCEKEIQGESALPLESSRVFEADRSRRAISQPAMLRSYNGLPGGVDRIAALGNAIVPQVAYEILKEIARIESLT